MKVFCIYLEQKVVCVFPTANKFQHNVSPFCRIRFHALTSSEPIDNKHFQELQRDASIHASLKRNVKIVSHLSKNYAHIYVMTHFITQTVSKPTCWL